MRLPIAAKRRSGGAENVRDAAPACFIFVDETKLPFTLSVYASPLAMSLPDIKRARCSARAEESDDVAILKQV